MPNCFANRTNQQSARLGESLSWFLQSSLPGILLIIATWVFMAVLINPRGNFPLNDDWAYGRAVKSLLETGSIHLSNWSAVNAVSQIFWGARQKDKRPCLIGMILSSIRRHFGPLPDGEAWFGFWTTPGTSLL
jgi:hypothetical protein